MNYTLKSPIQYTDVMTQILTTRGIKESDIEHFLNTTSADTYAPSELTNIDSAIKILITHIQQNHKVLVQADSDVDGYTSASLLLNYLNNLFPAAIQNNFSYRVHDEKVHGLLTETVSPEIQLIILPDASSNDYQEHQLMAERGVDIIVLDHHLADKVSEYACVVNNQLCDYPNKNLSGVGVAYKFCARIDELMGTAYAENYLDLVALGNIADMVDTREFETQYYIQTGLLQVQNPYFKEMCSRDAKHFGEGNVYQHDVAWYIAPYINAITREGTVDEKLLVFESMLEYKAYEQIPSTKRGCKGQFETRAEQAGRVSHNVKNRQDDATEAAVEYIENIIAENHLLNNKILIIKLEKNRITKNLNGLVANKLANKYQRPCLVLQHTAPDMWEGSGRGYDKSDFKDFRSFLLKSGLVTYSEGHNNAFGCGISESNIYPLIALANKELYMIDGNIKYEVDFIWNANELDPVNILTIADYKELWGQKVDEPKIAIENVKFTSETLHFLGAKGKTLRIDLPNKINAIKFFITDEEKEALDPGEETWFGNLIVECDNNEWQGNISPQFKLVDYEITKKLKYYF